MLSNADLKKLYSFLEKACRHNGKLSLDVVQDILLIFMEKYGHIDNYAEAEKICKAIVHFNKKKRMLYFARDARLLEENFNSINNNSNLQTQTSIIEEPDTFIEDKKLEIENLLVENIGYEKCKIFFEYINGSNKNDIKLVFGKRIRVLIIYKACLKLIAEHYVLDYYNLYDYMQDLINKKRKYNRKFRNV